MCDIFIIILTKTLLKLPHSQLWMENAVEILLHSGVYNSQNLKRLFCDPLKIPSVQSHSWEIYKLGNPIFRTPVYILSISVCTFAINNVIVTGESLSWRIDDVHIGFLHYENGDRSSGIEC